MSMNYVDDDDDGDGGRLVMMSDDSMIIWMLNRIVEISLMLI